MKGHGAGIPNLVMVAKEVLWEEIKGKAGFMKF
jgi:hypothetical protein